MSPAHRALTLASPSKINLFLEVLRRRPDGYHTLSTLFQEISLSDTLRVRARATSATTLVTNEGSLPTDETNLVLRAARVFQDAFPTTPGFSFSLTKRIPIGAGLGGGSGNAAAALKACWSLATGRSPVRAPWEALLPLARRLGADVPFFLRGGLASAGGVGDRLTFLSPRRGRTFHFVLVFPRIFSSTPEAYRALRFPLTKRRSGLKLTRAIQDGASPRLWAPWLFNRLEEAVLPRLVPVAQVKEALLRAGCLNALMTGSGSSVFGVVENSRHGRQVAARLRGEPWDVRLVSSVLRRLSSTTMVDEVGSHGNHRNSRHSPHGGQAQGLRHGHL
ncbi:MAG: 4-(cytidine 5'-diphospho)-2-C-methyl-D-erythritol kinase [Elusimicrobia bacterium]|nr:4-(cytidine 5'-diphospho)-2-C-methyl-D-erythritol kinase [Elusimicrobiota bacterium]